MQEDSKFVFHSPSRLKTHRVADIAVRVMLAIAFVGAAAFKLTGHPAAVEEFDTIGLGQWFRYVTAVLEISGAVLLLVPSTIFFGAALLSALCVGAFFAQLTALHGDFVHAIVLAAVFAAYTWFYRGQLMRFF
jgi:putative oxidoreductase